jgi:hypothetical protein
MAEACYRVRRAVGAVPDALLAVDALLAGTNVQILKDGSRTTVAALTLGDDALVVKRFRDRTLRDALVTVALGSGAVRAWTGAARLRAAGFPTPEILAVLERHRLGVPLCSCTVARRVPGVPLDELWRSRHGAPRRALTLAFADYVRGLHDAGVYPQDLRAPNVMVASEVPPTFVLVDLDRVRRYRRLSWRRRRKNIVQVHRSVGRGAAATVALRFLRRYLVGASRAELRRAAAEIARDGVMKDAEYARRRAAARHGDGR